MVEFVAEQRSPRPRRRKPRRGAVALVGLGAVLAATTSAWLATAGSTGLTITPPAGLSPTGAVADVTTLSSTVTRTNGNAHLQAGVAIARLDVQETFTTDIRVDVGWTNGSDAGQVLNNPNAQVSVGIYHAVHSGNCNGTTGTTVDAPLVNLTDSDGATYCLALDEGSTGSPTVSSAGKLLLARNSFTGWLKPAAVLASSPSACTTNTLNDNDVYCQPSAAGAASSGKRALYVIASIVTPGGLPQGQNATSGTLDFYVDVQRAG